jgi:hypothetical protein
LSTCECLLKLAMCEKETFLDFQNKWNYRQNKELKLQTGLTLMENAEGGEVLAVPKAEEERLLVDHHHLHVTRTVEVYVIEQR